MYLYSLFQRGKIYRAEEKYEEMVQLFKTFLNDDDSPKVRVSEALYWLGWAYQQDGKTNLAYPVFEDALVHYGNDTQAAETHSILQALEKIRHGDSPDGFANWLQSEIEQAEKRGQLTYLSRLVLYQQSRLPGKVPSTAALLALAELVPMDQLDPEALGQVGLALLEQDPEKAETYFTYLVDTFPRSSCRAMGYLGLATLAEESEAFEEAKNWLIQSEKEVPMHPRMNDAQLLLGKVLSKLEEYDAAIKTYEKLLRLKSARGKPHAQALSGIAQAHLGKEDRPKAIAYYQRVYNMYRAYPDLVSSAYMQSATLFESLDRISEAVRTLEEMLGHTKLAVYPEWEAAQRKLEFLLPLIPEEETNEAMESNDESPS